MACEEMSDPVSQIGLVKAVLWEEAKGKLRALCMAHGQCAPLYDVNNTKLDSGYEAIRDEVEAFIAEFESQGYHE